MLYVLIKKIWMDKAKHNCKSQSIDAFLQCLNHDVVRLNHIPLLLGSAIECARI